MQKNVHLARDRSQKADMVVTTKIEYEFDLKYGTTKILFPVYARNGPFADFFRGDKTT